MGFDRYRCVLDRIFPFLKLPEYRRRFRFRKYRTAFVSDEKNVKAKVESITDRFRPFSSLGCTYSVLYLWTGRTLSVTWSGAKFIFSGSSDGLLLLFSLPCMCIHK